MYSNQGNDRCRAIILFADVCMCVNGRCVHVLCVCVLTGMCKWEHLPSAFAGPLMVGLVACRTVRVLDFHGLFFNLGEPEGLGEWDICW